MQITALAWGNAAHTQLIVTLTGGIVAQVPWPCATWHVEPIQIARDAGMQIAEYVAPAPTQDQVDTAEARAYPKLAALAAMTPAQVQAWVAANVTNLAQAQDAIATLAIAVSVLARRL